MTLRSARSAPLLALLLACATLSSAVRVTPQGVSQPHPAAAADGSDPTFLNPVIPLQRPDPGVIIIDGVYYAASTSFNDSWAYPISMSKDLVTWELVSFIFPDVASMPKWIDRQNFWAPEFHWIGGRLMAYFVVTDTTGTLCVGVAVSPSGNVLGPWVDALGGPLVRSDVAGCIDPTAFQDPQTGRYYLLWKWNGSSITNSTPIWIAELASNGSALLTDPKFVFENDLQWEGGDVEAPWMIYAKGYYWLFYSGNSCWTPFYGVGVARATNVTGPFQKAPEPIMRANALYTGPGHCSVVPALHNPEAYVMMYHAWLGPFMNRPYFDRMMMIDPMGWDDNGWPCFPANGGTPSTVPTPVP